MKYMKKNAVLQESESRKNALTRIQWKYIQRPPKIHILKRNSN